MSKTILAIDATTEACSVALQHDHGMVSRYRETARGHSTMLLGMVEEALAEAGVARGALNIVAFCCGPGSFTGVRIAAGVAQGLAMGQEVPVAPVSTLACLAQRAYRETGAARVLSAIDARMGEVYWGAFTLGADGVMATEGREAVLHPDAVLLPDGDGWRVFGTGWGRYPKVLTARLGDRLAGEGGVLLPSAVDALPMARKLADAGELVPPEQAQPVYLRDQVTT